MQCIERGEAKKSGILYYFTGRPCKNGHVAERQTSNGCCVECTKERSQLAENKEKRRAGQKQHYQNNKDHKSAYAKEWWKNNPGKGAEYMRAWREKNKEKDRLMRRACESRRRSRMSGVTPKALFKWAKLQRKICYWCGDNCKKDYHIDHYVPISKGGPHELNNLVISCPFCNVSKKDRDPYEFAAQVGRLF